MSQAFALSVGQHIVRIGLFLVAAIAVFGGGLQMYLGQPNTRPGSTTCTGSWPASTWEQA